MVLFFFNIELLLEELLLYLKSWFVLEILDEDLFFFLLFGGILLFLFCVKFNCFFLWRLVLYMLRGRVLILNLVVFCLIVCCFMYMLWLCCLFFYY